MLPRPLPFRRSVSTALLAACLPVAASAVPVRIASFNICNASGAEKIAAISNILCRVRPDILALEEATTGQEAAYTTLFASLPNPLPHHVFMPNPGSGRGTQSDKVAIYSRWPIVSSSIVKETDADPDAVEFMRWPLHAVIEVEGALNPLHVIALHAAASTVSTPRRIWRGLETERVERFIADHVLAADPNATEYVVLGDFNDSADGRYGEDNASSFQPASFSYETFRKYETNGTFASPFRLGSDAAWHSNNASRASHTMLYRTYPNDRLAGMAPVTAYRTGSDDDWTTCLDGDVYRLDYILFSEEIATSSYGAPEGEAYFSPADREYDLGLDKPGDFSAVDPAASTNASDHLLLFADFHMIDEIGGITPVAILSEVAHCATNSGATFVELCNTGADELDLDGYRLELYLNGAAKASYTRKLPDVVLDAGGTYWIAGNAVNADNVWGRAPDATWSSLKSLDGNDAIVLRNPAGAIQDIYGAVGVDGRTRPWAYADSAASRVPGVTDPRSAWDADEWLLSPSAAATPGEHRALLEADVTLSLPQIHAHGRPSIAPTASEAFFFTATATPNTLASNLAASAVFRVDGGTWHTNAMHRTDPDGPDWESDALDVARGGGSVLDWYVTASFDGPGDLSPASSPLFHYTFPGAASATNLADVLLNEVKTSGAADFAELAGGAGVDVSGWSLTLFDTNAAVLWSYVIPPGTAIPSSGGARDEWGNDAGFLVLAADPSTPNAGAVLSGCRDGNGLFSDTEPRVLVLASSAGGVVDAVAWIATNDFESMVMADELSTSVARGAGNFLHCLGPAAAGAAESLQAPGNVRTGTDAPSVYAMPDWRAAAATPGAPNAGQADGSLVLARVDRDGDGLLDDEDNCPNEQNPAQSDIDDDGIGDECDGDMDGDGIPNALDNCPTEPNPAQEDFDADGIGNVCDPDWDEEENFGLRETLWVTFETLEAANPGSETAFSGGGRDWRLTGAVAGAEEADRKIGQKAMRASPGAVLLLDGVLENRLESVAFFFGPYGGETGAGDVVCEISADGTAWRECARVATRGATALSRAVVAVAGAPAGSRFRLRVEGSGGTPRLDIDNLLLVSVVQQLADATLDAPLSVAWDGAVHTNTFTVLPAGAAWRVSYAPEDGPATAAPVEPGAYTASLTVDDGDDLTGGTFVFPASLVILETLPDPEIVSGAAEAGAVAAELRAVVRPNRPEGGVLATFEYGTGGKFAGKVVANESPVGGTDETTVTATVAGLSPATRYDWRVNAGEVSGPTMTFETAPLAPPEPAASGVSATAFALSWPALPGATNYLLDIRLGEAVETQLAEHFDGWPRSATAGTVPTAVEGVGGGWQIVNASFYTGDGSGIGSDNVVYLRTKSNGWSSGAGANGSLATPAWEGIGEISFVARRAAGMGGNAAGTLALQESTDGGATWTDLAAYPIARTVSSNRFVFPAARGAPAQLRLCNTGSYGIYIHDVYATLASGAASLAGYPASCTGNACTVTGLAPATTYEVAAKVEYDGAASGWSGALAVTTAAKDPPPTLALAAALSDALAFEWNAVPGVARYLFELSPDADFAAGTSFAAEHFEGNATNADNTVTTSNGWLVAIAGSNCGVNTTATTGMAGTGNRIRWTRTSTATAALAVPVPADASAAIDSMALWAESGATGGLELFWGTGAETCTNPVAGFAEPAGTGSWQTASGIPLGTVSGGMLHLAFRKTATASACGVDDIVLAFSTGLRRLETAECAARVEGLTEKTTYHARVSADGGETWSGPVEAATLAGETVPPAAPELTVSDETTDGFTVSWAPVERADAYQVEWSGDAAFSGGPARVHAGFEEGVADGWTVGRTSGTSDPAVVSNAACAAEGTTHALRFTGEGRYVQTPRLAAPETLSFWYCVPTTNAWALAVQVAGEADFSDAVTLETLEVAEPVSVPVRHEVDLSAWSNVFVRLADARPNGAASHRFLDEITIAQDPRATVRSAAAEGTSLAVTGLGDNGTWFVRAAAANGSATSAWSEVATARTLPRYASLSVVPEPADAQWIVLGEPHAGGETVNGLEPGACEISFAPVDGFLTPAPVTVVLVAGETNVVEIAYERSVFLDPPVLAAGGETFHGFTVSWEAVPNAFSYELEWSRFDSFAGKGEDLFSDFEDGALPAGWSAAHDNGRYWAWGVVSNAHTAAAGMGKAFRFDHSEAGAYLALPRIPSPGGLTYRYAVPDSRPWQLAVQVASREDFADAVTVDALSTTGAVAVALAHTVDLSAFTNMYVRLLDQRTNSTTNPRYVDEIAVTAREGTEVFSDSDAASPYALEGLGSGETWFVRAAAANASVTSAWSEVAGTQTVPCPAGVSVVLEPAEATWFLLGEEHASGETVGGLDAGDCEISFGDVHGWETPAPVTVTLEQGETNAYRFAYDESPAGITVVLDPPEATWFLLGEEHASGETVGGLAAGDCEISFGDIHGWETPEPATVTPAAGETNEFRFAYAASPAGVTVTLDPPEATWFLLGEEHASGETVGGLAAGDCEITFSPVDGYDTPPPLAVALAAGETNVFEIAYEETVFLDAPVLAVGGETTDGFTVSWEAVPNAFSYELEWSRFDSFAGKGEDLFSDFEDGALPAGWSAAHDNGRYWAWGVVSNAHTAAAGMGKAFRFDHSEAGAYLALPRIPSPGGLAYRYAVPDSRPWQLAVQVASREDFADAVTVDALSTTGAVAVALAHTVDLSAFTNVYVRLLDQRTNSTTDPRYVDEIAVTAREGTEVFSDSDAASPYALEGLGSGETWFVRALAANAAATSAWSAVASGTTRTGTMTDYERWAAAAGVADLWGTNAEGVAWAEEYLRWTNGLDALHAAARDGTYEILVPTNEHGIAVDIEVADDLPGGAWRAPADGELSPAGENRYGVHPTNDPAALFLRLRLSPAD